MKDKFLTILITALLLCGISIPASAQSRTAMQTLEQAAAKINKAAGLSASFQISAAGKSIKGSIKAKGNKFAITTPQSSSWCDGKNLWVYNASSKETTLSIPTAEELAENNPLSYITNSAASRFKATYGKNAPAGHVSIILTPLKRSSGITAIVITLNSKSLMPTKIVAKQNGETSTIQISSLTLGKKLPDSDFQYPKSKYPKTQVIDLR